MRHFKVLATFLIILSFAQSNGESEYSDYNDPSDNSYICRGRKTDNISLDTILKLIDKHSVTTVEQLLREIDQVSTVTERAMLMYRSRSLQAGSFQNPRAILYGCGGDMVISFNGHPSQRGYNRVELMRFLPKEERFEFRELIFQEGKKPKISAANPKKCLLCHQSPSRSERGDVDPRPNWEPYSIWPGAYGSDAGDLFPIPHYVKRDDFRYVSGEDDIYLREQAMEQDQFKRFKERAKTHPRYKYLRRLNAHDSVVVTDIFALKNFRRIMRQLRAKPEIYQRYRYVLAYFFKRRKVRLPEEVFHWHNDSVEDREFNRAAGTSNKWAKEAQYRVPGRLDDWPVAQAMQLFFEPLGFDMSDWYMDFRTRGRFAFLSRFGTRTGAREIFKEVFSRLEPELFNQSEEWLDFEIKKIFGDMKKEKWQALNVGERVVRDRPVIQVCARCHDSANTTTIPRIPFGDRQALTKALVKAGYPRGRLIEEISYRTGSHAVFSEQMPPGRSLTHKEREEFLQALYKLIED